jgi:hypothetical protein
LKVRSKELVLTFEFGSGSAYGKGEKEEKGKRSGERSEWRLKLERMESAV